MGKEQANERLYYYYEFLFKVLKKGVTPLELLEDIEATAWEYVYQTQDREMDFGVLYSSICQELKQIKEALE